MNDPRHLLILTSKTGGGHVSLAESLADLLAEDFTSSVIDPQPRWIHRHYQLVSRYALWLWSAEFQLSNTPGRASRAHKLFSGLIRSRLRTLIAHERPAAVLSTYPFFSYSVQKIAPQMPLVLLYSDPRTLHSAWLTVKNAALHLSPSREVYAQALAAQVEPEKTHLIGWPTRRQFYAPDASAAEWAWAETGFNRQRLTIFLQGGGEGSAGFARTVERLLAQTDSHGQPALQLILAAGTNQLLQRRFREHQRCHVLPFTKTIAPWMACADLVMGKAGPNMLFESVTLGKPFLATTFIPGQEEGNLEMIRKYGLGWVALTGEEQIGLIQRLLRQPEALREKEATVETYRAWNQAGIAKVPALVQAAILAKR
jgi:UDP-N-acetylglucosamine:LPS N-acetylglucosamine transferase